MESATTVDNCIDVLNMSEIYSLSTCRTQIRQFILNVFDFLSDTEQYNQLSHTQMASLLAENSLKVSYGSVFNLKSAEFNGFALSYYYLQYIMLLVASGRQSVVYSTVSSLQVNSEYQLYHDVLIQVNSEYNVPTVSLCPHTGE